MKDFLALLGLLALLVFPPGCGGNDSPTTTPTPTGPPYTQTDLVVGTGATAMVNNFLTVSYTGWLYDASRPDGKGTQFDSGTHQFRLGTGAVIRGWDIGVVGMRVGGQRRLVIPPDLAYGSAGQGPIPPNATLVFDITLLNVQ